MLRSVLPLVGTALLTVPALPQGKVLLVLGSDTAIWDGMDVAQYHCTYSTSLFSDPAQNAGKVMDASFRAGLTDSYGTPVKFTWWMMAGNIFRYATNTNVPHPNTMTMYLMRRYHGPAIAAWGDELTLHYHTFVWTDYNHDGLWYWNQALGFPESRTDFDVTLAELLLEEEVFPVSFRSGWHYMDNAWQQDLDSLLLYSMHNDWPAVRRDTTEPLDNTYDWSRSPSAFTPFHPSVTDYQVPGNGRGWNLRSVYMSSVDSTFMEGVFAAAKQGKDQVVCLWAHLPETDFPDNVRRVNTAAHAVAPRYPGIPFRYCTAVEAMQAWRHTQDTTRPVLTIQESGGATVRWTVTTGEQLFQPVPFVALKTRDGEYRVLSCTRLTPTTWQTVDGIPRQEIAKIGVAGTDTAGNVGHTLLRYVPEDLFVEDVDAGYSELRGTWSTSLTAAWGRTSRASTLGPTDTAAVRWTPPLIGSGLYNIFVQAPVPASPAMNVVFTILEHGVAVDSITFPQGITTSGWTYLTTRQISDTSQHVLEMRAHGLPSGTTVMTADVAKYSGLVRERWFIAPDLVDAGEVVVRDTLDLSLKLQNRGTSVLTVAGTSQGSEITLKTPLPLAIPPMSSRDLHLTAYFMHTGVVADSITLTSDDPLNPVHTLLFRASVRNYYRIVDDLDTTGYHESGVWSFSSGKAYGTTSRYIYPVPGASATFQTVLRDGGPYEVSAILPTTVNASTRARYALLVDGIVRDSLFRDQNTGSGAWVTLFHTTFNPGALASVVVTDAMSPVVAGKVLRADAIRFSWIPLTGSVDRTMVPMPDHTSLAQNYPNPFNSSTLVVYEVSGVRRQESVAGSQSSDAGGVKLGIYDILGREVAVLVDEKKAPGRYEARWDAAGLPSGVYFCRLTVGAFVGTTKMLLMR